MTQRTYPSYWLYKDNAGQFRWSYAASNGRVIAVSSESYLRKADCLRGIEIMKGSSSAPVWLPEDLVNAA
ncbi:YegP family protein [Roseococcus suduntuyensis]|uniref:YegP family protein n=1 Tax=Roseococcus suduntuyensis TaxID=455361 RepID=UPI0016112E67|nr:DUF1508 domain-containing protein [Roseococcus suduntuyensis]